MKRIILAVVLLGITAGPAFAKDLCVQNIFGQLLKFDNVKLLKGKTTALVGRFHPAGSDTNTPVNGVLTVDSDNVTTRIGIVSFPIGAVSSVGWTMTGDKASMRLVILITTRLAGMMALTLGPA